MDKLKKPLYRNLIIACLLIITVGTFSGTALARKTVHIVDTAGEKTISTFATTVKDLLQQEGITLHPADHVSPEPSTPLREGMTISVERAFPVNITADGSVRTIYTRAKTVEDVIAEAGISLNKEDRVMPDLKNPVRAFANIQVVRITHKKLVERVTVDYQKETVRSDRLPQGTRQVKQQGRPGLVEKTIDITLADGKEINRQVTEKVVKKAVNEVIVLGTKSAMQLASRGGEQLRYREKFTMEATAYVAGGRTATGRPAVYGVAAVDPRIIPLGTRVYVDGYGYAIAADVGSAIKGQKIDLCFSTREEAIRFGRRMVTVYILE